VLCGLTDSQRQSIPFREPYAPAPVPGLKCQIEPSRNLAGALGDNIFLSILMSGLREGEFWGENISQYRASWIGDRTRGSRFSLGKCKQI